MKRKIVAICNCPIGVAHTYMAAEALTKAAQEKGYQIKVETQGAFGTECELTDEDIREAEFVILALGTTLSSENYEKFKHKRIIQKPINEVLKDPHKVFKEMENTQVLPRQSSAKLRAALQKYVLAHLMKGMSFMIPLAVAAGLLVSLASIGGAVPEVGSYREVLYRTGLIGLELMLPVLAAGIAYSIGDRQALAPTLIGGYLLTHYELLGTNYSGGMLGAILVGFIGGYVTQTLGRIKVSYEMAPLMKFMGIPLTTTLVLVTSIYYGIAPVVAYIMSHFNQMLSELSLRSQILVCIVLGLMLVIDMGGPINKTAYLFALGMVSEGQRLYFGIVALVVMLPAAAVGLATLVAPELFNKTERENGKSALVLGLMGLSEPAIMYAVNDPISVIGAQMIAATITSILGCIAKVERMAPGVNIFDPLFGNVRPAMPFYSILVIGIVTNCILIIIFKKIRRWQHV
ncbi:MAG: fructose-specific PTS transporter subunit EIIC [Cellulosilyticaceae bacterium]